MPGITLNLLKPEEYFHSQVHEATNKLEVTLDSQLEFYLVNLLCNFISYDKFDDSDLVDPLDTPLAIMLKKALEADPSTQIKIYKTLGDTSLYLSGYFQDYFKRKIYDVDYFISMGVSAFKSLSDIIRTKHNDHDFAIMYQDLSIQFRLLVKIITFIASNDVGNRKII